MTLPIATSGWGARRRERLALEPELRWATQDQMPVDGVPYVWDATIR